MALKVRHARDSGKPAGPDATKIQGPDWDADHKIIDTATGLPFTGTLLPIATVLDYDGHTVPAGFLECAGQPISAVAYALLFAALVKSAAVTVSPGPPTVISWAAHGLRIGDAIRFKAATLPNGIGAGKYYVAAAGFAAGSFRITATFGGVTEIAATTAGSSVVAIHAPHGVTDDLATFNVPDHRSAVLAGVSNMGGATSALMVTPGTVGDTVGDDEVVLAATQMPTHAHDGVTGIQNANHTHGNAGTGSGSGTTDTHAGHQHWTTGTFEDYPNAPTGGNHHYLQPANEGGGNAWSPLSDVGGAHAHGFSVSVTLSGSTGIQQQNHAHVINPAGGGLGHPNVQPTQFTRKMIYAGV
jgi:microcystin-dependent protein